MKVPRWAWGLWAVGFVVLEAVGLFNGQPDDTLTETIHHLLPGWAVFAFLGWLSYHFLVTYLEKRNGR